MLKFFIVKFEQTQVFFSNYFTIPNISPRSVILGFMEEIQDQHNIIINHILLIYKLYVYLSRNSEGLNFIHLKKLYVRNISINKTTNDTLSFCIKDVSAARNFVSAACNFYKNNEKHYFSPSGTKSTERVTTIVMDFQISVVVISRH